MDQGLDSLVLLVRRRSLHLLALVRKRDDGSQPETLR